jgi:hypothetical protein
MLHEVVEPFTPSRKGGFPMADLYASTSPASLSPGSKYAAEFNERLKSDMPLIDAVRWWYLAIGGPDVVNIDKLEMDMELSPAEDAAFGLCLYGSLEASYETSCEASPPVTDEYVFGGREQQNWWATLKQARTALQVQS